MTSVPVEQATRRRRRRQDSELEILETAGRLLRERPFRDLTVDDLMAETSQSRTAFYRHFSDRRDLVVRLVRDLNEELWAMSEGWLKGAGDPLTEGRDAIERLAGVYRAHGPLLLAIAEAAHHDGDLERVYRGLMQGFIDATTSRIERDVAAGLTTVPHPEQTATALVWMTERHLEEAFGRGDADPGRQAAAVEALYTIWMRALYGVDPRPPVSS